MPNSSRANQKGYVALLPVLLVGAVFVLVVTFGNSSMKNISLVQSEVLSESTTGDEEDREDVDGEDTPKPYGTPEPYETNEPEIDPIDPKPIETLKPRYTEKPQKTLAPRPSKKPERQKTLKPTKSPVVKVEIEDENEEEHEFEYEVEETLPEGSRSAKVTIQRSGENVKLRQDFTSARVQKDLPIEVDDNTNQLTITTPSGSHPVAILPETAADKLVENGVVETVLKDDSGRNDVRVSADANGEPIYTVKGLEVKKLLGLFNVNVEKIAQVSMTDGSIVKIDQSFVSKLLDFLSSK